MCANKNTKINKKNQNSEEKREKKITMFFRKLKRIQKKSGFSFIILLKEISFWPEVSNPLCFKVQGGSLTVTDIGQRTDGKKIHVSNNGWKRLNSLSYETKLKEVCQEAPNYL